jgi:hypothetical protein
MRLAAGSSRPADELGQPRRDSAPDVLRARAQAVIAVDDNDRPRGTRHRHPERVARPLYDQHWHGDRIELRLAARRGARALAARP